MVLQAESGRWIVRGAPSCLAMAAVPPYHTDALAMAAAPPCHANALACDSEGITLPTSGKSNGNKRRRVDPDGIRRASASGTNVQFHEHLPVDGPTSLEEVLDWPQFVVCRLLDHASSNGKGPAFNKRCSK